MRHGLTGLSGLETGGLIHLRTLAAAHGPLKGRMLQAERLRSEHVRLILSGENNWPAPSHILHSDSACPGGNERINNGKYTQRADKVEPAG